MNDNEPVAKKHHNPSAPRGGSRQKIVRRTFDERLRAVQLHLQEGFTIALVAQELGVSAAAVDKWLQRYRHQGEAGLKDHAPGPRRPKLPEPVRDQIIALKKEDPSRGIKRISQLLKRVSLCKGIDRMMKIPR